MRYGREMLYSKPDLKARGWTAGLIAAFLPEVDDERSNPFSKKSPPMQMYLRNRVEKIEQSPLFAEQIAKTTKRKAGAKKAVITKTERLLKYVNACEITVERVNLDRVARQSNESHLHHLGTMRYRDLTDRDLVNCIRHEYTEYDSILDTLVCEVGKQQAYLLLRTRVLEEIAKVYPELAQECDRQEHEGITRAMGTSS